MKYFVAILAILAIAIGSAAIVLGEADDSPGLQLLGVVLVVVGGLARPTGPDPRRHRRSAQGYQPSARGSS